MIYPTARLATLLALALLQGCATKGPTLPADLSPTPKLQDISNQPQGPCPLWVYRNQTFYKSISFDFDLPYASLNDVPVGKLGVGQTHCLNVPPGHYHLSVKEPNIFGPLLRAETIIDVAAGQTVYLRYAMDFAGFAVIGTVVNANSNHSLQLVSAQDWQARK